MNGKYLTWFNELSTADQLEELAEIVGDITDDEGDMLDMVAWINARTLIAIMQTGNVKVKVGRCYA
jgi:hypothetical protein